MKELNDHIESALKKEVNFRLPENFSDKIVNRIMERAQRESRWELAGIITAAILIIAAFVVTLYYTDFKFSFGALTFLGEHVGLIAFGIVFIALLHFFDKKIVRKHQVS
jgi:hypothetical protein